MITGPSWGMTGMRLAGCRLFAREGDARDLLEIVEERDFVPAGEELADCLLLAVADFQS